MGAGAAIVAAVAAVVGAGTAIYSADQQRKTVHQAEDQANEAKAAQTAALEEAAAKEAAATLKENEQIEALARARAAASGLGGVSTEVYMSALEEEGQERLDGIEQVKQSNIDVIKASGGTYSTNWAEAVAPAIGQLASGLTGAYSYWSQSTASTAATGSMPSYAGW